MQQAKTVIQQHLERSQGSTCRTLAQVRNLFARPAGRDTAHVMSCICWQPLREPNKATRREAFSGMQNPVFEKSWESVTYGTLQHPSCRVLGTNKHPSANRPASVVKNRATCKKLEGHRIIEQLQFYQMECACKR